MSAFASTTSRKLAVLNLHTGERVTALLGFAVLASSLCLLGFIDEIAGAFDSINPLQILAWFGIVLLIGSGIGILVLLRPWR